MILREACICDVAVPRPENEIASAMKPPRKIAITYAFTNTKKNKDRKSDWDFQSLFCHILWWAATRGAIYS